MKNHWNSTLKRRCQDAVGSEGGAPGSPGVSAGSAGAPGPSPRKTARRNGPAESTLPPPERLADMLSAEAAARVPPSPAGQRVGIGGAGGAFHSYQSPLMPQRTRNPPPSPAASVLSSPPGLAALAGLPSDYQRLARLAAVQAGSPGAAATPTAPAATVNPPSAAAFAAHLSAAAAASPSVMRLQPSTPTVQETPPPSGSANGQGLQDMIKTMLKDSVREYLKCVASVSTPTA